MKREHLANEALKRKHLEIEVCRKDHLRKDKTENENPKIEHMRRKVRNGTSDKDEHDNPNKEDLERDNLKRKVYIYLPKNIFL